MRCNKMEMLDDMIELMAGSAGKGGAQFLTALVLTHYGVFARRQDKTALTLELECLSLGRFCRCAAARSV